MTPLLWTPPYGRGPSGEIWKLEENLYPFVELVTGVLSDRPLFFLINSYTTGLAPSVLTYLLETLLSRRYGGSTVSDELGLPVTHSGLMLPPAARPDAGPQRESEEQAMATMIKAEHLTFCYPDEPADHPPVLDDVNLEIEAGSFVAILGHNGSGKSTLAKHMNALLTPTAGKLWGEGLDTADPENLLAVRGKVGMVFQNPDNQIVASVVEEDVAFGPENLGVPPADPAAGGHRAPHGGDV